MSRRLTEIERILALPDPQLAFKWISKPLPFGHKAEYVEAVDINHNNIAASEGVYFGSRFVYFPGTHTIAAFTLTLYEDRLGTSQKWINDWKSRVKDMESGAYGLPSDYKRNIEVQLLDQKNLPVATYKMIDCWPTDTQPFSLNYTDGSGRITVAQTFSVDHSQVTFHR